MAKCVTGSATIQVKEDPPPFPGNEDDWAPAFDIMRDDLSSMRLITSVQFSNNRLILRVAVIGLLCLLVKYFVPVNHDLAHLDHVCVRKLAFYFLCLHHCNDLRHRKRRVAGDCINQSCL